MTEKMNEGTAIGILGPIGPDADEMIDSVVKEMLKIAEATKKALKEVEETEGKVVSDDTENRSPFHSTVEGMLSADYRERFKAEYQQTKIRYEKLKALNNCIEAAHRSENADMPLHDCPPSLLREQQAAMGKYLHILEVRAVIAGIDL